MEQVPGNQEVLIRNIMIKYVSPELFAINYQVST